MKVSVSSLKDFDISMDGRNAILNFDSVSLKITTMELEKVVHELGFLLIKARQLSDISKQGIVPFLRPTKVRGSLLGDGRAVVASFQLASGLELHYGMDLDVADALTAQLQEAAQQGRKATPPRRH
jgi:hypothetical protein